MLKVDGDAKVEEKDGPLAIYVEYNITLYLGRTLGLQQGTNLSLVGY